MIKYELITELNQNGNGYLIKIHFENNKTRKLLLTQNEFVSIANDINIISFYDIQKHFNY